MDLSWKVVWLCICVVTLFQLSQIISGVPLPEANSAGNSSTANTSSTGGTPRKKRGHGIFNSFLCGAGYTWDAKSQACQFVHQEKSGSEEEFVEPTTEAVSSVEDVVYPEDTEQISHDGNGFFPLECGINYRYLKKAKICKPVTAPLDSADEEENDPNIDSSASEE